MTGNSPAVFVWGRPAGAAAARHSGVRAKKGTNRLEKEIEKESLCTASLFKKRTLFV